ncbi:MAG: YifB family Mg chelatase-like AAA ATPase [Pseudomonadales bacterium]|nr:YifB family Mg chelatase-like AAA ATPase [Pseudomonadales bacterium]
MSLAIVYTRARVGIDAPLVTVEVHLSNGLPGLSIVGLPETEVKESKDRVRSALLNANFEFPARRITINLAPADLPKEGGRFDLPIALGILAASQQISSDFLQDYEYLGELALSGQLRPVQGALPAAISCNGDQRALFVPTENGDEAALANDSRVYTAGHLLDVCAHLNGEKPIPQHQTLFHNSQQTELDLLDVKGQHQAKRALEIAAAGGHNLLMIGPPGTGKTMLASRLPGILPPLDDQEALEVASVQSVSGQFDPLQQWRKRPFRTPHHTASGVALVGGSSSPKPGEISLAHKGVLFLDELPEFSRKVLEVLREPLESGEITISRAARQVRFPADFQLVAAMNPCPCGYAGDASGRCHCSSQQIERYRDRISGPLLDRIDLHLTVPTLPKSALSKTDLHTEPSAAVLGRVTSARQFQLKRQQKPNRELTTSELEQHCKLTADNQKLLETAMEKLNLSARAYHRIIKVARTIADLEGQTEIAQPHLSEAISYRTLDRK